MNDDIKNFCKLLAISNPDKTEEELYSMYQEMTKGKQPAEPKDNDTIVSSSPQQSPPVEENLSTGGEPSGVTETPTKEVTSSELNMEKDEELQPDKLLKCNVAMLKSLCKKYKLKVSGKKQDLIDRLLTEKSGKIVPGVSKVTKKKAKKTKATPVEQKPLFQKIQENIPIIQIRRNSHGNFEHKETGLVFDSADKCVVGKQEGESIAQLTKEDIETCDRYHFTYRIPENLGSTKITEEDNEILDKKLLEEFEN